MLTLYVCHLRKPTPF